MGRICLGRILELGPKRNMGVNYLVGICSVSAHQIFKRLQGQTGGLAVCFGLCSSYFHIFWGKLSFARYAQLFGACRLNKE